MSQPVTPRRTTRASASAPDSPSSPPKSRTKPSPRRQLLAAAAAVAPDSPSSPPKSRPKPSPRRQLLAAAAPVPDSPSSPTKSRPKSSHKRQLHAAAGPVPDSPSSPPKSRPKSSHKRPLLAATDAPNENNPLNTLLEAVPGRRAQAADLLRLLAPAPALPVLLHGGAATGKTRALLLALRHLRPSPRLVYAALRSLPSPRALFASILSQLRAAPSSSTPSRQRVPDKPSDFVPALRDALAGVVSQGENVYLVFDNLEVVRGWDKGGQLVSLLLRLHDLLRLPQVVLVYVSSAAPDAYYTMTGSVEPNHVYFPDYTVDEVHGILMRGQPNPKLYSSFLSVALKPFFRVTRRVDELAAALEPLFRRYCEPLGSLNGVPDEGIRRRLFEHLQPHLAVALNETFSVPMRASVDDCKDGISGGKGSVKRQFGGRDGLSSELEFHMSVSAKYLLLSAFLASRNPATLDAALFDATGGTDSRNRKRKSSQASIDRKDTMAEELLMKGPGTFPLERLLAIFQCITSVSEDMLDEVECEDTIMGGSGMNALMSDVLLQLSTLCNSNFLSKSRSCPLEGSGRYRSNIDEDLALKVARSVSFPLSKYMYRR
ncbi:origin of replication complex subunit 5 [Lolium perenne]|uniref:origin of replication complex subunit 5 n=1 Tax=Lolium perenne TaxID=4522 RepID=UPI0021EA1998|nr:origin of replication complex subunit 5 [Lolium perenne]